MPYASSTYGLESAKTCLSAKIIFFRKSVFRNVCQLHVTKERFFLKNDFHPKTDFADSRPYHAPAKNTGHALTIQSGMAKSHPSKDTRLLWLPEMNVPEIEINDCRTLLYKPSSHHAILEHHSS